MSLETATYVNSLVETWPDGSSDTVSQGDDHIRLLKASIKRTFPNIAGEVSVSSGEINMLKYVPQWLSCEVNGSSISAVSILKNITFTGNDNKVSGNPANMYWVDTGAGANGGRWRIGATGGDLLLQARDDSNSAATTFITVERSATNVTAIKLTTNGVPDQVYLRSGGRVDLNNGTVQAILSYSVTPTFQVGTISNHNMDLVANNATRMVIRGDGPFKTQTFTVATLPAAATVGTGARSFVTDANATTFASIVAGGGSNQIPVYSDGTNWRIG